MNNNRLDPDFIKRCQEIEIQEHVKIYNESLNEER
jgi:hypothetical protein